MHKVANALQIIMGNIDMADQEIDRTKTRAFLRKARDEIRALAALLQSRVLKRTKKDSSR
jgi:two-component sensor histidine kinase